MALTPSTMLPLGTPLPSFSLPGLDGQPVSSHQFPHARALCIAFICNHCPYVVHLKQAIVQFARDYDPLGLAFIAINSNDVESYPEDSPARMKTDAERYGYTFPYLFDATQEVARTFKAACTPDFYLFDADRKLAYRGRFDASRPGNDQPINGADLRAAADAVLEGKPVPGEQLPSMGCNIKWLPGNAPEYFA